MPKESRRDTHQGPLGEAGATVLDDAHGAVVDDDLVVAGLDEAACGVLELLARLHEQVVAAGGDLDGDALARVARPDVQARVARPAVDGQEVEVRVEAGQDRVFLAVLG